MDVGVLMKDNGAVGVNILTKVYCSREASDVLQIKLVFVTAFRYKFGSFIQQVVAVGLNNHEFFGQAKVASFRRVVLGPGSCNNGPFYVEVYRVVLQLPDVFGQFSAVSVFSVSECNLVLIKQGRPGGVVEYQYTRKKIDKIPQIPPNIPKNNRSFEYFIPKIRTNKGFL